MCWERSVQKKKRQSDVLLGDSGLGGWGGE